MHKVSFTKRQLLGVFTGMLMASSLLALAPRAHAQEDGNYFADPGAEPIPSTRVNAFGVGATSATAPGNIPSNFEAQIFPGQTLYWYYDESGPGRMKIVPKNAYQFEVRILQNGRLYTGSGVRRQVRPGRYWVQWRVRGRAGVFLFDGQTLLNGRYGYVRYTNGWYVSHWFINRVNGPTPFNVTAVEAADNNATAPGNGGTNPGNGGTNPGNDDWDDTNPGNGGTDPGEDGGDYGDGWDF